MNMIVASRPEVERGFAVREPCVAISISDPDAGPADVRLGGTCREVLFLEFNDEAPIEGFDLPPGVRLMSAEDAKAIWQFFNRHRDKVGTIVVNCEAGISRSSAVAAAICRSLGGDDSEFFEEYQPNRHVYEMVLAARDEAAAEEGR